MPNAEAGTEALSRLHGNGVIVTPYERAEPQFAVTIELEEGDEAHDDVPVVMGAGIEETDLVRENAAEIALVLAAHAADQPDLKNETKCLAMNVATSLMNLGCTVGAEQVRVLSYASLSQFFGQLPSSMRGESQARVAGYVAHVLGGRMVMTMADMLHVRLGADLADAIGPAACAELDEAVARKVTMPFLQRRTSPADHFGENVWKSFHEALRLQVGFTLAGMKAQRDLVSPFLELFAQGNFPLGLLDDETFLVLVA